jgi:Tfp pilus assembly protein PilX
MFKLSNSPTKYNLSKTNKGVALILTILVLVGILAIAMGVTSLMVGEIRMTREIPRALKAYYVAEVGIEKKLYQMRQEEPPDTSNIGSPPDCTGGGAVCLNGSDVCYSVNVDITSNPPPNLPPNVYIKSYGCYKRIKRSIEVSY